MSKTATEKVEAADVCIGCQRKLDDDTRYHKYFCSYLCWAAEVTSDWLED